MDKENHDSQLLTAADKEAESLSKPSAPTSSEEGKESAEKTENNNNNNEGEGENFLVTSSSKSHRATSSKGELICVGNIGGTSSSSLQSNFLKFRDQKLKERQIMKLSQQLDATSQQRSEDFRNALRTKFLERAKFYLGVPYARRFEDPASPEAPLYLDCCALVRQCIQDLSSEFGFIIGRWNQCYQMDTLPIVLDSIEECKPGDLIFYEGLYNSKRSKPQKHNNVHVEIFMGGEHGAESTIASRYHKGKVSIFPSYKFTSTTWSLVKHHFRSIDTWLNGICKSCCPEHAWQSDSLNYLEAAGKRSIFSVDHEGKKHREEEEDDVRADNDDSDQEDGAEGQGKPRHEEEDEGDEEGGGDGDDEEEEEGEGHPGEGAGAFLSPKHAPSDPVIPHSSSKKGNNNNSDPVSPGNREKAMSADAILLEAVLTSANKTANLSQSLDQLAVTGQEVKKPAAAPSPEKKTTHDSSAGDATSSKKNPPRNRRMLSKSLDNDTEFSSKKTSPTANETAAGEGKDSAKLVTTTSASNMGGNSNKSSGTNNASDKRPKRISKYSSGSNSYHSDSDNNKEKDKDNNPPSVSGRSVPAAAKKADGKTITSADGTAITVPTAHTYYVCKSNGWKLVKAALDRRGWQQLPFDYQFSSKYGLKWVERRSQIDYRSHQAGQLVCHIPNNDIITTKIGLLTILRDKFCSKTLPAAQRKPFPPWLPMTYDLESPSDITALFDYCHSLPDNQGNEMIWIYKPSCNNRGRGIRVVSGYENLQLICYGKQGNTVNTSPPSTKEATAKETAAAASAASNNKDAAAAGDEAGETIPPLKGIVQKYITNPLLIGAEGFKFDIRCYLFIARNYPTTYAFYHPGYCRLALKPYKTADLDDPLMHLTNASVQKKGGDLYEDNKDIQIQAVSGVAEQMAALGKQSSADYMLYQLDHEIKLCMVDVMKSCNHKLMKKHGYFDLLGCDFMITDDNKLHLLEINTNPALSLDNKVLEDLLPNVIDGALELVLKSQGQEVSDLNAVHFHPNDPLPFKFQLIFDEKNNWNYADNK